MSDWLQIHDVTKIHVGKPRNHDGRWNAQNLLFKKADGSQFQVTAYSPRDGDIETKVDE